MQTSINCVSHSRAGARSRNLGNSLLCRSRAPSLMSGKSWGASLPTGLRKTLLGDCPSSCFLPTRASAVDGRCQLLSAGFCCVRSGNLIPIFLLVPLSAERQLSRNFFLVLGASLAYEVGAYCSCLCPPTHVSQGNSYVLPFSELVLIPSSEE